jgi:hypothetical protein
MADETTNPRIAHIEAELARTVVKLEAVHRRATELEQQVVALEFQLEQEHGKASPEPAPAEE